MPGSSLECPEQNSNFSCKHDGASEAVHACWQTQQTQTASQVHTQSDPLEGAYGVRLIFTECNPERCAQSI